MYIEGFENIMMELKYCERCGGLWMRRVNSGVAFCAGCALEMANMGAPQRKRSRPKMKVNAIDIKAQMRVAPSPCPALGLAVAPSGIAGEA